MNAKWRGFHSRQGTTSEGERNRLLADLSKGAPALLAPVNNTLAVDLRSGIAQISGQMAAPAWDIPAETCGAGWLHVIRRVSCECGGLLPIFGRSWKWGKRGQVSAHGRGVCACKGDQTGQLGREKGSRRVSAEMPNRIGAEEAWKVINGRNSNKILHRDRQRTARRADQLVKCELANVTVQSRRAKGSEMTSRLQRRQKARSKPEKSRQSPSHLHEKPFIKWSSPWNLRESPHKKAELPLKISGLLRQVLSQYLSELSAFRSVEYRKKLLRPS